MKQSIKESVLDIRVGYILNKQKFRAAGIACMLAGSLALGGLILMDENDVKEPPTTEVFRPRTGPTFELPHSDDGPSITIEPYSFPVEGAPTGTTLATVNKTP